MIHSFKMPFLLTIIALISIVLFLAWFSKLYKYENVLATPQKPNFFRHQDAVELRMAEGITSGPQMKNFNPGELPSTAHYVWCGDKIFTFRDYLGVLSIVRFLEPLRISFYYNNLPQTDGSFYHSWFTELQQSLPSLILNKIDRPFNCNTMDAVDFALEQMASNKVGGVYVGERAVLTHVPDTWKTGKYFTYQKQDNSSSEDMIVFVKRGIDGKNESDIKQFKINVLNQKLKCYSPEKFETTMEPCIVMTGQIFPENILNSSTSFSALLRELYYKKMEQNNDESELVPLINHLVFLNPKPGNPIEWNFEKYISLLSALYVGGSERVYVYGDTEPSGKLWERLKKQNVTFVYVDQPYSVFQQDVNVMEHRSDILRVQILYKYGGAYNDYDVIWTKPLSEEQRSYPASGSYDFAQVKVWPRQINNGVVVSKPKSLFLSKVLESFRHYRDDIWSYNSCLMYYKIYEKYPHIFHIDTRLQVGCHLGICHPTWFSDFQRVWNDRRPTTRIDIKEANSFQIFEHKDFIPVTSFSQHVNKTSIEGVLLRNVIAALREAGKHHLLEDV